MGTEPLTHEMCRHAGSLSDEHVGGYALDASASKHLLQTSCVWTASQVPASVDSTTSVGMDALSWQSHDARAWMRPSENGMPFQFDPRH